MAYKNAAHKQLKFILNLAVIKIKNIL
jgi:hypothetical protein